MGAAREFEFLRLLATDSKAQQGLRKACAIFSQNPALRNGTLRVGSFTISSHGVGASSGVVAGPPSPVIPPAVTPATVASSQAAAAAPPPVVGDDHTVPSSTTKKKKKKKKTKKASAATTGGDAGPPASSSSSESPLAPPSPPKPASTSVAVPVSRTSCSAVVAPAAGDSNAGKIHADIVKFVRAYVTKYYPQGKSSKLPPIRLTELKFSFPSDTELFVVQVPASSDAACDKDLGSRLLSMWSSDRPVKERKNEISYFLDADPRDDGVYDDDDEV